MSPETRRRIALFLAAFLLICGGLVLFPAPDRWASGLFYRPGAGFFLADWPPFYYAHNDLRYFVTALVVIEAGLLLAAVARRPVCGVDTRAALFLLLSLAIGPGLLVNSLFKDHWGRARPAQVTLFGGNARFTPAFVPSRQCWSNCSFPAGDPAVGFSLVSIGFLAAAPARRRRLIAGALALGAALGVVRIAQGGHFLSDVIASGFLVFATSWLLHRWIVMGDGLRHLGRVLSRPPPGLRRFAGLGAVTAAAIALAVAYLDLPLAIAFHDDNPTVQHVFRIITTFGISTGWLVAAAGLALICALAARRQGDPARARRLAQAAWRAGFVFLAVAGAGLAGDILKPLFGRARPKLWFSEHIFGFTWHGGAAAYWSFPSGHTITIVALAAALSLIHPRGLPYYSAAAALVAASRIVLTEHYLSDVLGGTFIALAVVWAVAAAFHRAGVALAPEP